MAYEQPSFTLGQFNLDFDGSSVASTQYTAVFVKNASDVQGTGQGNAALGRPAAGGIILGVLQSNGVLGEAVAVMQKGVTMALVSGSGKCGDLLGVDANGQFLKASGGQFAVGLALEDYQAGSVISVLLDQFGKQ